MSSLSLGKCHWQPVELLTLSLIGACARLLRASPATAEDRALWLVLFSLLRTVLATGSVSEDTLLCMAAAVSAAAMPFLAASAARPAPSSLPLSLFGAADAFTSSMFAAAQDQLQQAQLAQVPDLLAMLQTHGLTCQCMGTVWPGLLLQVGLVRAAERTQDMQQRDCCCGLPAVPAGLPGAAAAHGARLRPERALLPHAGRACHPRPGGAARVAVRGHAGVRIPEHSGGPARSGAAGASSVLTCDSSMPTISLPQLCLPCPPLSRACAIATIVSRCKACSLLMLVLQVGCVGDTWRLDPGAQQGSRWDDDVVACLGSLVRRGQALAKACTGDDADTPGWAALHGIMACLRQVTAAVPAAAWAPAWAAVRCSTGARVASD